MADSIRAARPVLVVLLLGAVACSDGTVTSAGTNSISTVARPTCTPPAGRYTDPQSVTCTSSTPGSTTRCTTNGTAPGPGSPVCTNVAVSSSLTVRAYATAPDLPDSPVAVGVYVIGADTDLCAGLVQDKANHAMTAVAKPGAGQAYTDPAFATTIRRITDAVAAGAPSHIVPVYSTIQAWNADESYLMLYWVSSGHHLYNGKTYAHIKAIDINPPEPEQFYWDLADPKILYYVSGRTLYRFNVDTEATTAVQSFTSVCSTSVTGGVDPMWTSWGPDQIFGFVCGQQHFTYNLATATIGTAGTAASGGNHPAPGPSGQYFFLNLADSAAQVRNVNMSLLRTLSGISSQEHASLGSSDGVDTFFSVQWGTYEGTVVASNLATGASRVLVGPATGWPSPPSGTHVSAIAYKNPGWLAASVVGATSGATTLNQELLLVNANTGGKVCRVGHHRSTGSPYWAEPHVSISPTGTRMIFGSNWGGTAVTDTYVVELPGYVP